MIDWLHEIDSQLFLLLHGLHSSYLDAVMYAFSGKWIWVPMYVIVAAMVIRLKGWRTGMVYILGAALAVAIADQTCATIIRPLAQRLRPSHPENPISSMVMLVNEYRGGAYGFPSCHAANSFAFAVFMALFLPGRKGGIALICWAVANSFTRIYLGVHYPGDLLVGGAIGCISGLGCYYLARMVERRYIPSTFGRYNEKAVLTIGTHKVSAADAIIVAMLLTVAWICILGLL